MDERIQRETTTNTSNNEVLVSSDTSEKLREGFEKAMIKARELASAWKKKQESSPRKYRCNSCLKVLGSIGGYKKHIGAKSCTCDKKLGYDIISSLTVSTEDRMTAKELATNELLKKSRIAAVNAQQKILGNNIGKITADELMKAPFGIIELRIKKASKEVLSEFVKMKFSSADSSKKIIAERELQIRA
ncbi:MAG: hypothetical protein M0P71_01430 [Melioribacteraceae bacterium]|nr:hypothetical protein [Melioribacteraceae bacterium]